MGGKDKKKKEKLTLTGEIRRILTSSILPVDLVYVHTLKLNCRLTSLLRCFAPCFHSSVHLKKKNLSKVSVNISIVALYKWCMSFTYSLHLNRLFVHHFQLNRLESHSGPLTRTTVCCNLCIQHWVSLWMCKDDCSQHKLSSLFSCLMRCKLFGAQAAHWKKDDVGESGKFQYAAHRILTTRSACEQTATYLHIVYKLTVSIY